MKLYKDKIKVLIGTPYYKSVDPRFVTSLLEMMMYSTHHILCSHMFVQGTNAARQRNALARTAVTSGYDYLLTVDSDMVFPPNALDSLVDANAPFPHSSVVGAIYKGRLGRNKKRLMLFKEDRIEENGSFVYYNDVGDLPTLLTPFKVAGIGSAFFLTSTKILDYMFEEDVVNKHGLPYNYWTVQGQGPIGPDLSFCHRLNLFGIGIFADPRINVGHISDEILYPFEEDENEKIS